MLACYLRLVRAGFRRYSTYRQAVIEFDGLRREFRRRRGVRLAAVDTVTLIAAVAARAAVRDLQVVEPSLEDVVRTRYTG